MTVLRAFADERTKPTVSELAATVGLSRPAVRRILLTFEKLGYARQYRGEWSITPRILEIGQGYFTSDSLPEISQPFLQGVADRTHESTSVSVWDETDVVHVARVEVQRIMPYAIRVGSRLPAHATAMGKVLLGGLSEDELDKFFASHELERFTPATLTDAAVLRECIAADRERGYSLSVEELEPGMLAAAVPISVAGTIIGTLSSTSTSIRSSTQKLVSEIVPLLQATSAEIARAYFLSNRHGPGMPR
jgi:IclR family pca regulon transcriptional regulator